MIYLTGALSAAGKHAVAFNGVRDRESLPLTLRKGVEVRRDATPTPCVEEFAAAGAGSVTISIPEDVGARVEVEGVASRVQLEGGWSRDGEAYINAAHGDAEVELRIEITIAAGSVRLVSVGE